MPVSDSIIKENKSYWTGRADGYSKVNQEELSSGQKNLWKTCLTNEIRAHFPDQESSDLHVLDIGTGPGFFSILLAEAGFLVTAVDLTPAMLAEARRNAGPLADEIRFMEMNAEQLSFEDHSFDVVISRNLTWNLPHPEEAYREWCRILKNGGLLLNFDSNWYRYLFDEEARKGYASDRENSLASGVGDRNIGEGFDVMEEIASRVPLSGLLRPAWDLRVLTRLGLAVTADPDIWKKVWTHSEQVNFFSTPMFMISARKPGIL